MYCKVDTPQDTAVCIFNSKYCYEDLIFRNYLKNIPEEDFRNFLSGFGFEYTDAQWDAQSIDFKEPPYIDMRWFLEESFEYYWTIGRTAGGADGLIKMFDKLKYLYYTVTGLHTKDYRSLIAQYGENINLQIKVSGCGLQMDIPVIIDAKEELESCKSGYKKKFEQYKKIVDEQFEQEKRKMSQLLDKSNIIVPFGTRKCYPLITFYDNKLYIGKPFIYKPDKAFYDGVTYDISESEIFKKGIEIYAGVAIGINQNNPMENIIKDVKLFKVSLDKSSKYDISYMVTLFEHYHINCLGSQKVIGTKFDDSIFPRVYFASNLINLTSLARTAPEGLPSSDAIKEYIEKNKNKLKKITYFDMTDMTE